MKGKIHSVETMGAVDGPGLRYVLFLKGCPLRCAFCHNPDTWAVTDSLERTAEDVAADVLKYREFFAASHGGFTVSGGEPLLQSAFLAELFKILKANNVHIAVDTCGCVDITEQVAEAVELADLFLLDIKHLDPETHKDLTGRTNEKVLEFLDYLTAKNKPIHIRIVLVNGYSAAPEYLERLAEFLKGFPTIKRIDLLPYHTLGVKKWESLKIPYRLTDAAITTPQQCEAAREIFGKRGFETTLQ